MEKLREEFEQIVGELEWQDVADTLQELCSNIMCDPTNSLPTPSTHPPNQHPPSNAPASHAYAGISFDGHPQLARLPQRLPFVPHAQLVPLPSMRYGPQFNPYLVHPIHLSRQAGAPFRLQYLPCQMPQQQVVHSQPSFSFPTAPQQPKKSLPVVPLPEGTTLHAVGMLNGEVLYAAVDTSQATPPPLPPATSTCSSGRKRKCKRRRKSAGVKKPPNAFMCFLRERRPEFKSQHKDSVAVNKLLAQLWTSMSKEQQAKYYEQAYMEKMVHEQMSSDGSSSSNGNNASNNNTGPKKKRRRSNASAARHATPRHNADGWNTADDAPASTYSSSFASSSSSLSSWLEAVITAEGVDSPDEPCTSALCAGASCAAAPCSAASDANKCPDSGEESDIEGMDARLLHLLGCC
ncbi:transcription factor 7-like 1-C isoform X2 [Phyllopteryx taeniolatus]|uniref:transcription factor 7-like 1-C isoform X2 n=1 Tax=Phyllopteryx taeniolatus TaxID=161469 RepID=UPI002AD369B6|nr:transcription factor 7-like 1-C isoform X2 [Phyllopteryx taeniolatus]